MSFLLRQSDRATYFKLSPALVSTSRCSRRPCHRFAAGRPQLGLRVRRNDRSVSPKRLRSILVFGAVWSRRLRCTTLVFTFTLTKICPRTRSRPQSVRHTTPVCRRRSMRSARILSIPRVLQDRETSEFARRATSSRPQCAGEEEARGMSEVAQLEQGSGDTGIAHDAPVPVKPLPQWAYRPKSQIPSSSCGG